MIEPLCKVCGERHFGAEHVWKGARPEASVVPLKPAPVRADIRPVRQAVSNIVSNKPPKSNATGFDKKAYQRAYMAKRRAKT